MQSKVSRVFQDRYTYPCIRLIGNWIGEAGLTYGDSLDIKIEGNKIIVEKKEGENGTSEFRIHETNQ